MPNITCPHCQREFYMANHLDETRPSGLVASLEDRIHELEHSERVNNLESNQLKHSNRLVDLESEVDALRRLIDDVSKASGRYCRQIEEEMEELKDREKFDQQKRRYEEMTKNKYDPLGTALQEIEWLKERVEDIERAVTQQRAQVPEHLAQALSSEQIEKSRQVTGEGVDQRTVHQKLDYIINKLNYEHYD